MSCSLRSRPKEAGIALLISIFVLLLICVVAIALIVASGTESALAGNYRSATSSYYAALAGLEEARGRLLLRNADYFANFIPTAGTPPLPSLPLIEVRYVLNPNPAGEDVRALWPDTEYDQEFGLGTLGGRNVVLINSVWNGAAIPGPLYKWVRINAVTEQSLKIDVDGDGVRDPAATLYYDGSTLTRNGLVGSQVLEITALAVLPNGSQKLLQYLVAPVGLFPPNFTFPAAITLVGNDVIFTGPNSNQFNANGNDQFGVGGCAPTAPPVAAIGYTNNSDSSQSNILSPTVNSHKSHYTGAGGTTPNVSDVGGMVPPDLQTPAGLDSLVQNITQNADTVIQGNASQFDLPSAMSATNPMTVVVQGDLTLNGWHGTGYGLLVVTGDFHYDPDASWKGIVLVIGRGIFYSTQGGTGEFDGTMLVAQTRDSSNILLSSLGPSSFSLTGGGKGVYYSSCWINAAQSTVTFKTLSFHEIQQ